MLKVTYLSHSGFLFDDGKYKLLIDPYITGNPHAVNSIDELNVDFIALTHAHGDHLGDAIKIANINNATLITVNELGNHLAEMGLNTHRMHIGGAFNFPFGRLKFTIAHHGSSTADGKYMGEPAGIVLKMGGQTVYHCGDTGLFLDMKLIGEIDKINLLLLPIGDNFTMGIDDAVKAVEFVHPDIAVPMHYNTFPIIKADPYEFKTKVESLRKKCIVMEFGETIEF